MEDTIRGGQELSTIGTSSEAQVIVPVFGWPVVRVSPFSEPGEQEFHKRPGNLPILVPRISLGKRGKAVNAGRVR